MRPRSRLPAVASFLLLAAGPAGAQDGPRAPRLPDDPRLGELRRASTVWGLKRGPTRVVVDQVALVPDVATFFEAIAAWDDAHWFPILIDDPEYVPKFLRAFRPSRVVRLPSRAAAIPREATWGRAIRAVLDSWRRDPAGAPPAAMPERPGARGEFVPESLGLTSPGVVLATPDSPSLAGAVALAAGRFQPLVPWETKFSRNDKLGEDQARRLALDLEVAVSGVAPRFAALGDDCDFLTLAAPYPVRYVIPGSGFKSGEAAFDDLIGRKPESLDRWAYAGRLEGDPSASVYRAMSALFLQPRSAVLFDSYDDRDEGFRPYAMKAAEVRLPDGLARTLIDGPKADLSGWTGAFSPINRFGLVYINSRGGPYTFGLGGTDEGIAADIPPSVPSVVLMNHSYSASDPSDPRTLAGSWLSGGAFLYFGSLNEPYIQAFRPPSLVISLLNEGLPIAPAVRMLPVESPELGTPWRLHLLGDPLYRIDAKGLGAARLRAWPPTSGWPAYRDEPPPPATATDADRLAWALKATIRDAAAGRDEEAVEKVLLAVRRESLPPDLRAVRDGLLVDLLPRTRSRRDEVLGRLVAIPGPERPASVALAIDRARVAGLQVSINQGDWPRASDSWSTLVRSETSDELKREVTRRVGRFAEQTNRVASWKTRLQEVSDGRAGRSEAKACDEELKRLDGLPTALPASSSRRSQSGLR